MITGSLEEEGTREARGQDRGCEGRGWAEALAGVQVWECKPRRQASVLWMRWEADL